MFLFGKEGRGKKGGEMQTLTQSCLPRSHLVTKLEQMTAVCDLCRCVIYYNIRVLPTTEVSASANCQSNEIQNSQNMIFLAAFWGLVQCPMST